jgi:transposase
MRLRQSGQVTRSAELSEAAWAWSEPLMPQAVGRSRPWRDHRQVVEGIVRYRTGVAWRDLRQVVEGIVFRYRTGVAWRDLRQVVEGIVFRYRTGVAWRDLRAIRAVADGVEAASSLRDRWHVGQAVARDSG